MNLYILTNQKKVKDIMSPWERSRKYQLKYVSLEEGLGLLKKETEVSIAYLDVTGMETKEIRRHIKGLTKDENTILGIIDIKNEVDDPADLFHQGVSDYINKGLSSEIKPGRLKKVEEFGISCFSDKEQDCDKIKEQANLPPKRKLVPQADWSKVIEGKNYSFCFLYVEMDLPSDWRKKAGADHLKKAKELFHNHIQRSVEPANGQIWMWNEFGGLILFPYDNSTNKPVQASIRMIFNRVISSVEEFPFKTRINYRLALHIGETLYHRRGATGTIVSDTVNFIFHLGQQFAEPGRFYITQEIFDDMDEGMKILFSPQGEFEGRTIHRLRSPK